MRLGRRDFLRAGAVLGAAAVTGCTSRHGGPPVATTTTRKSNDLGMPSLVRLGVAEFRPYAHRDNDGELTGQVVAVARFACGRLEIDVEFAIAPYDTLVPDLLAGRFDVVGGVAISPQNCARVARSVPDHQLLSALAVPTGNPKGLTTFTEVVATGARLAVAADSPELRGAQAAGVSELAVISRGELLQSVVDGRFDCVADNDVSLRDQAARMQGVAVRPPFEPVGGAALYGFAFNEDTTTLAAGFEGAVSDLHETGRWLDLSAKYGFTERNLPDPGVTSESVCH